MARKPRRKVGDFLAIKLNDKEYCFGRVLDSTAYAFYDFKAPDYDIDLDELISSPILFKIPVTEHAIREGIWKIIGSAPLEDKLKEPIKYFNRDRISGQLFIYDDNTGKKVPASREECESLECAAVWAPEHVEDRLRDHYAGVPNKWLESLKMK